jgi:hypothetical protein
MKNFKTLLVLTLVLSFTSCVYSQTKKIKPKTATVTAQKVKPTREETIRFIDNTLKLMIGSHEDNKKLNLVKDCIFSIDKLEIETFYDDSLRITHIFSEIPWDQLKEIKLVGENVLSLNFNTSKMKLTTFVDGNPTTYYKDYIAIYLTRNIIEKKGSLIKAFNRLAELAKEENKDPFKD